MSSEPAECLAVSPVVARLAPSPTGQLHLGNIRTFLWAWLSARAQGGRVIMRIEDLDSPRVKPGVSEKMIDDLKWLGFDWDEGPGADPQPEPGAQKNEERFAPFLGRQECLPHRPLGGQEYLSDRSFVQTERRGFYRAVFQKVLDANAVFPCVCTRGDIAAAQSAPHAGEHELRYPGTCRERFSLDEIARFANDPAAKVNWRLRVSDETIAFDDMLFGRCEANPYREVGEFIIAKAPDNPAYQLAVVADDIDMNVTEVVRGDDLIPSTARQLLIYRLLKAAPPKYGHAPLMVGPDGMRLAKRHGEARVAAYREKGVSAGRIIGVLARWSGLDVSGDCSPADLISKWSWKSVRKERVVLTEGMLRELD